MSKSLLRALTVSAVLSLSVLGAHAADSGPSLHEVYTAAQAGRIDQAHQMMQKVLADHPTSAKAHYVEAELFAKEGLMARAKEELALADKYAKPGSPYAKPESVAALRAQIDRSGASVPAAIQAAPVPQAVPVPAPAVQQRAVEPKGSSIPWGLILVVGAAGAVFWVVTRRRQAQLQAAANGPYGVPATGGGFGPAQQPYSPMPAGGYPAPSGGMGLGAKMAGGLATGLAVGAGVMAAEAIGHKVFGDNRDGPRHDSGNGGNIANNNGGFDPVFNDRANPDMGGQDFGVNDAGSWDDGGSGGGSDWDN